MISASLRQRPDTFRSARLLRDGQGWPVLPERRQTASYLKTPAVSLMVRWRGRACSASQQLRATSRLHYFCRTGLLCSDDCRPVRVAPDASQRRTAVRAVDIRYTCDYIVMALFIDIVLLRYKRSSRPGLMWCCSGFRYISRGHEARARRAYRRTVVAGVKEKPHAWKCCCNQAAQSANGRGARKQASIA